MIIKPLFWSSNLCLDHQTFVLIDQTLSERKDWLVSIGVEWGLGFRATFEFFNRLQTRGLWKLMVHHQITRICNSSVHSIISSHKRSGGSKPNVSLKFFRFSNESTFVLICWPPQDLQVSKDRGPIPQYRSGPVVPLQKLQVYICLYNTELTVLSTDWTEFCILFVCCHLFCRTNTDTSKKTLIWLAKLVP